MSTLAAKEIRLLFPAFAAAFLLAVAPVWLLPKDGNNAAATLTLFPFGLGVALLAIAAFGREFGLKTFPLLLAQPLERERIWRTKVAVLAGAMVTVVLAWFLSCLASGRAWSQSRYDWISFSWNLSTWTGLDAGLGPTDWSQTCALALTSTVVAFAGGLWTTLLVRQFVAAFWLTVLIPFGILILVGMVGGSVHLAYGAMALYAVTGFWWAHRQFRRAQEVSWTGGEVVLPALFAARSATPAARRTYRPVAALFWKELQLHQITLAGLGWLFALHLGVLLLRRLGSDSLGYTLRMALQVFGAVWLVVPLLAGSPSVAEERRLGTFQSHLCLPLSSRRQVGIKLLMVVLLGGVLSAVLPWIAEGIGTQVHAGSDIGWFKIPFNPESLVLLCFIGVSLALIGFYASTLVRGVLQSLAVAVLMALALWLGFRFVANPQDFFAAPLWNGPLAQVIAWPTFGFTFLWLAYRNYRVASESWGLWRRNVLAWAGALLFVTVLTASLYHRVWEWVTPPEPAHGPARLVGTKPVRLEVFDGNGLGCLLPDGRLWLDKACYNQNWCLLGFCSGQWVNLEREQLLPGSNWLSVAVGGREVVAVRADGTLWVSEKPPRTWRGLEVPAGPLVQFGTETDWKAAVQEQAASPIVLLKQNGSLWSWGPASHSDPSTWPGLRAFKPTRLGPEGSWARMLPIEGALFLWKNDDQAWMLQPAGWSVPGGQNPETKLQRLPAFDHLRWRSLQPWMNLLVGLRDDGSLWTWDFDRWGRAPSLSAAQTATRMIRIGADSDWRAIAAGFGRLAGVKTNGSLWVWAHTQWTASPAWLASEPPVRLSRHQDWVGVGSLMNNICSLAADGSLWYWWQQEGLPYYQQSEDQPWLAPSRRPVQIANILK